MKLFYIKQIIYWIQGKNPVYEIFLKGKKCLDMWCWEGKLLQQDKENIFGIDLNKSEISRLQEEWYQVRLENVTHTTFSDESFDCIVSDNVIEHLYPEDAYTMLEEIKRLLRKDGILILKTPLPKIIWNSFWHIKPYPPASIQKLFRKNSREKFNSLSWLKIEATYFYWNYSENKFIFLIFSILAIFFPYFRISYLMIIKKYD